MVTYKVKQVVLDEEVKYFVYTLDSVSHRPLYLEVYENMFKAFVTYVCKQLYVWQRNTPWCF